MQRRYSQTPQHLFLIEISFTKVRIAELELKWQNVYACNLYKECKRLATCTQIGDLKENMLNETIRSRLHLRLTSKATKESEKRTFAVMLHARLARAEIRTQGESAEKCRERRKWDRRNGSRVEQFAGCRCFVGWSLWSFAFDERAGVKGGAGQLRLPGGCLL